MTDPGREDATQDRALRDRIEAIMRGEESPGTLAAPLWLMEKVYAAAVRGRNALYDHGIVRPVKAACPVISVGNLTVGGSGKTPFVELLLKKLDKKRPGVLSRGYGQASTDRVTVVSDGKALGAPPPFTADEAYMLARKAPGVPVVCAPKRAEGARALVERFGVGVIVLDDGFQHRALARDLDIVLSPVETVARRGRMLPRGMLREPERNLGRADMVVFTGAADEKRLAEAKDRARSLAGRDIPIARARGRISGFTGLDGAGEFTPDGPVFLFCGIAGPERFRDGIEGMGLEVAGSRHFPDHHFFSGAEIETIDEQARKTGAKWIVTTGKDAARLAGTRGEFSMPCAVARYSMEITEGEDALDKAMGGLF